MSRKKYSARDKNLNKLTRDGLVERNAATGEEKRISMRETELDLRQRDAESETYSQVGNTPAKKRKKGAYHKPEPTQIADNQPAQQPYEPSNSNTSLRHSRDTEQAADTADDAAQQPVQAVDVDKPSGGKLKSQRNTAYRQSEPTALQHDTADAPQTQVKPQGAKKPKTTYTPDTPQSEQEDIPSDATQPTTETSFEPDARSQPETRTAQPDTAELPQTSGKPESALKTEKQGKLQFSQYETAPDAAGEPNRKLAKAERGMERTADKLEKAKDKLPSKRKVGTQRVFDEKTGKVKHKLNFEKEVKPQSQHMKGALPLRPVKAAGNALMLNAHRKIYQVEHENVGVKAAHRAEMIGEAGIRSALHFHKTAPYNKVRKLERAAAKKSVKLSYQRALAENPKLKSSVFSRMAQKRKIKKDYAKAARDAKKTAQNVKKDASYSGRAVKALAGIIRRHPIAAAAVVLFALLLFAIMSLFSVFGGAGSGAFGGILSASYLAEDADIDNAELSYTEWETDLQFQINRTESDYPGYDEYRYNVGDISHNPYELMAYLTVMYQNFSHDAISGELRALFDAQYTLTYTTTTETRYADPTDANDDGDYEPYEWKILTVTLTAQPFGSVITPRMDSEQLQHYSILMQSKGSRQYLANPFGDMNWLSYVTSYYGWRVHPISGAKDLHRAVDIGLPTGTEIQSGQDGTVTFAGYSDGYGNVVIIENDKGLVSKYAHCDTLLVSAGQTVMMGDVIATVGSTGNSTGPHLHLEVMKDGQYLNPLYYADTGSFNAGPSYGYAGAAMGDGTYAALIAEAEKYLGYPYIWGGSSPETSFDCSGYVSWVLTQSGVKNTGRLGAQGLYNICTPVLAAEAKPGDLIFFTGTYSAPMPVTHVGIYVGDGIMLHCGNPIQYTSINTSYWQSHFYAFGRLSD